MWKSERFQEPAGRAVISSWPPIRVEWVEARWRAPTGRPLRRDRHLQDTVALVREQIVGLFDVVELVVVRHERSEIGPPGRYDFHEPPHALLAAWAERRHDRVVAQPRAKCVKRDLEVSRIDAEARQDAARP